AYALSGGSVDVVVGVWFFAAGFTRKAAPSACARRFRNPRRSQCTPGNVDHADLASIGAGAPRASGGRMRGRRAFTPAPGPRPGYAERDETPAGQGPGPARGAAAGAVARLCARAAGAGGL